MREQVKNRLSRELAKAADAGAAIAAYEAEMFAHMRQMTAETMTNTEMFYAHGAARRIAGMFKHFGRQAAGR